MLIKRCVIFLVFFCIFLTPTVSSVLGSYSIKETPEVTEEKTPARIDQPGFQVARPDIKIIKGIVQPGDTASTLLNKYLPMKTIYEINRQSADIFSLRRIRKGQPYRLIIEEGNLTGFEYEIDEQDRLVIQRENNQFSIRQVPINYDLSVEVVSATITSSLFEAVRKIGEQSELAWKLSDIFAWDIDFIRDIRPGDQFQVLVEKRYKEGKLSGYGKIQAAIFDNAGNRFQAFRHKDSKGISGYYDENGNSLQKAFLKAPLSFSRISSKFTPKRMHPILKEYRPHGGVDYAAPMGTPIKTVGDGIITGIGYSKSMGNHVIIRHCSGYITRYYHMSKFAKGMKKRKRVLQGQVIGHVGMTGYATGPHLCFRMIKNGTLVNPLTHKSPAATPVNFLEMEHFLTKAQQFQKILTADKQTASLKKSA